MDPLDDEYRDSKDSLLTMSFNQDGECLAVCTGTGFRTCNIRPFQETFRSSLGGERLAGRRGAVSHARYFCLHFQGEGLENYRHLSNFLPNAINN